MTSPPSDATYIQRRQMLESRLNYQQPADPQHNAWVAAELMVFVQAWIDEAGRRHDTR